MFCCFQSKTPSSVESHGDKMSPAAARISNAALAEDMRQWQQAQTRINDFLRQRRTQAASDDDALYANIGERSISGPEEASVGSSRVERDGEDGEVATHAASDPEQCEAVYVVSASADSD
ncbi:hypothetical protein BOX15_Mlig028686g2 [Macrostomum lignano]|uniref:Uncharacterized protein n=1 Tax=Macrostomum lignano TaxID=282301 RepID=A0A267FK58_9PLAT|nr:hypothetical protein BOX15_Mlig028686g1 [Macrostomum lignano]PAA74141.1 hypothetical protein BOX15_Mlig028686g2 [Macrostomum lignano]